MGFLFGNKKEKMIAIFDIGSSSVSGAMVQVPLEKKDIPIILKSVSHEIKFNEDFNFINFINDMTVTLNESANALYDKKIGAPDEIYCVLASPWYLSETRDIKYSQNKSFTFTKHLGNDLIQKEILDLEEIYKNKYNTKESSPEVIEQHTMSVLLNGYALEEPLGKHCHSLEMNMVISVAPQLCLNKIRETLSKTFHHRKVNFSSFTLMSYLAVRDKYIDQDSYLLLDIRGEITDVGIVTKGVLKAVLSFPFGKKTFFKYMCTKMEIELRDAKELFRLYSSDNLSEEYKKKVVPLFQSIQKSWSEAFQQCISTLPRTLILPGIIFLTADSDIKSWFAEALRNEEYIQSTTLDHKTTVVTLDGPNFLNMCDIKDGACDPFLMIESIAIMRKMGK